MTQPIDPDAVAAELDAMKELAKLLAPLTPNQRTVILDWARQFRTPLYRGTDIAFPKGDQ